MVLAQDRDAIGEVVDVFLILPDEELGAVLQVGIAKVPTSGSSICRSQR